MVGLCCSAPLLRLGSAEARAGAELLLGSSAAGRGLPIRADAFRLAMPQQCYDTAHLLRAQVPVLFWRCAATALIKKDGFPLSKKGLPTKFPALLSKWEVCY